MMITRPGRQFTARHDHSVCISNALDKARSICAGGRLRFTPLRRRIFELVWSSHQAVLAYELLKQLRREKENAEPPTIYRALDFLLENHLIHRLESLNAYVGCEHPERLHISQFLICHSCRQVLELAATEVSAEIIARATANGFDVQHQTI